VKERALIEKGDQEATWLMLLQGEKLLDINVVEIQSRASSLKVFFPLGH